MIDTLDLEVGSVVIHIYNRYINICTDISVVIMRYKTYLSSCSCI